MGLTWTGLVQLVYELEWGVVRRSWDSWEEEEKVGVSSLSDCCLPCCPSTSRRY